MSQIDSALTALVTTIEANLRERLTGELRQAIVRELTEELERERLEAVPIDRKEAARLLGVSVDYLDDLRRTDCAFPQPFEIIPNRPSWLASDIVTYRETKRVKSRYAGR